MSNNTFKQRFAAWWSGESAELPMPVPPMAETADKTVKISPLKKKFAAWKAKNGARSAEILYRIAAVMTCLVFVGVMVTTVAFLPGFGDPENPANNEVPKVYIEEGMESTGAVNVVAGMILDYRAFDTFGESCVLFVAACAVMLLLRRGDHEPRDDFDELLYEMEDPRHDVILKKISVFLVPLIILFGIYVVFGGHLGPGGGFSGGAIMGAALIIYANAFGAKQARRFFTYKTHQRIVTVSLTFYAAAKGYSFFMGANHLPSGIPLGTPGDIISSGLILPLNIAVGLIVASTMYSLYIIFSKGEML